jgi:hypothetical protein
MENKNAVALKTRDVAPQSNAIQMTIEPLSAGVLTIAKEF